MLPDRVSNPGPLTYKSGALPIVLRGPAQSISDRLPEKGRKRTERIDESKNVQTIPTYCKHNRPLPYYHPNCRTPRHWKFTQYHRTTRPPPCPTVNQIVGRPSTGSLPSTIAPPDHPRKRWKQKIVQYYFF